MSLDQQRSARRAGALDGGAEGLQNMLRIAAVHGETLHAVALGALVEVGRYELFAGGGRVGVLVVLDDEDHGHGEHGGEIERLVDVAGAGRAVTEEREADGGPAEAALGIGAADDVREHDAEVRDHRQAPVGRVAVMDVAFAGLGRAAAVGEILAQVFAEVAAPDQVAAEATVGKTDDVDRLVGEEGEGDDKRLVALAAGDGALDQSLAEKVEDAVIGGPGELHPGVGAQLACGLPQFSQPQVAAGKQIRRGRKCHSVARCRPAATASRKKFHRRPGWRRLIPLAYRPTAGRRARKSRAPARSADTSP
jgi:hypothetical protein